MTTFSRLLVVLGFVTTSAVAVAAHDGTHALERLSFNRPESWALKYFASATLPAGLETPRSRDPWSIAFGVELGWLKPVSAADRFIGFDGTKQEDLNKAPFFARPRVTIGLPGRLAVTVAVEPPVRTFGLTPHLVALAVERPLRESEPWAVGVRGYGQVGSVRGAYACPASVLAFAPGSPQNLYGCQAVSSDVATLRFVGAELSVAHRSSASRWEPHAALAVNYMDLGFHVDALTFGFEDHTQYASRGVTIAGSAGVGYRLTPRLSAAVDGFYTPLPVTRGGTTRNDPFFNVRALLVYRLR